MIPSNRQTTLEWPEATLGCPLVQGYTSGASPQFDRTSIEAAPPAFFRMRDHDRRQFTLSFLWTLEQIAAFETFVETTLNHGMRWFMMKQVADTRGTPLFCHVVGGYRLNPLQNSIILHSVALDVIGFWRSA